MKKISIPTIAVIAALVFLSSCSEKFDVATPYKNITTVFGLLDISDSAHYVRIEKAFLDQNKSALVMAQVPDSIYYPVSQLNVSIEAISNGTAVNTYTLNRVDLNNENYPKVAGTFSTSHNYAYKFKGALNPYYSYRILVKNLATGEVDSSETQIIDSNTGTFQIQSPYYDRTIVNNPFTANFTRTTATILVSGIAPVSAAMFQGFIRVHWTDSNSTTKTSSYHSADWNFDNEPIAPGGSSTNVNYSLGANVINFYLFLRDNIGTAPAGVSRYLTTLDVIVYAGNNDMFQYQQVASLQGTGISGLDAQPVYTNLKGNNVLGLFAARTSVANYGYVYPDTDTRDSILYSPTIQAIIGPGGGNLNIVDVRHN